MMYPCSRFCDGAGVLAARIRAPGANRQAGREADEDLRSDSETQVVRLREPRLERAAATAIESPSADGLERPPWPGPIDATLNREERRVAS
jgi:hypothetical protein